MVKAAQQAWPPMASPTEVFSVTSWSELARDGLACEQQALHSEAEPGVPFIATRQLAGRGPVIAASDYVRGRCRRALSALIRPGRAPPT